MHLFMIITYHSFENNFQIFCIPPSVLHIWIWQSFWHLLWISYDIIKALHVLNEVSLLSFKTIYFLHRCWIVKNSLLDPSSKPTVVVPQMLQSFTQNIISSMTLQKISFLSLSKILSTLDNYSLCFQCSLISISHYFSSFQCHLLAF